MLMAAIRVRIGGGVVIIHMEDACSFYMTLGIYIKRGWVMYACGGETSDRKWRNTWIV